MTRSRVFERQPAEASADKELQFCQQAAALHLQRVVALADTEWKVSLAFWGVLLVSGLSFISFTNSSELPMTDYIAHSDIMFLVPYLLSAVFFVFGFSINQAKSIVEERTRFRHYVNRAAVLAGHDYIVPGGDVNASIHIMRDNRVWAFKLLATFTVITGIWGASQWLAHGKLTAMSWQQTHPHATGFHGAMGPREIACAFFNCHDRGYWVIGDGPEAGTMLWIATFLGASWFFQRAYRGGQR